ncbi:hypothetical protein HanRHA438_Chr10g0440721 [Helianthus annuus]|nr:hypothetical protein HanRHA438_Chr10g0440721 [Helianthus annuus]
MVLDDPTPQNYVQILKHNVQIPQTNKQKKWGPLFCSVMDVGIPTETTGDVGGGMTGWSATDGNGPKPIPIPYSLRFIIPLYVIKH